jgi:hypothetical protein
MFCTGRFFGTLAFRLYLLALALLHCAPKKKMIEKERTLSFVLAQQSSDNNAKYLVLVCDLFVPFFPEAASLSPILLMLLVQRLLARDQGV